MIRRAIRFFSLLTLMVVAFAPLASSSTERVRLKVDQPGSDHYDLWIKHLDRLGPRKATISAYGWVDIRLKWEDKGGTYLFECKIDAPEDATFQVTETLDDSIVGEQGGGLVDGKLIFATSIGADQTISDFTYRIDSEHKWTLYWCDLSKL